MDFCPHNHDKICLFVSNIWQAVGTEKIVDSADCFLWKSFHSKRSGSEQDHRLLHGSRENWLWFRTDPHLKDLFHNTGKFGVSFCFLPSLPDETFGENGVDSTNWKRYKLSAFYRNQCDKGPALNVDLKHVFFLPRGGGGEGMFLLSPDFKWSFSSTKQTIPNTVFEILVNINTLQTVFWASKMAFGGDFAQFKRRKPSSIFCHCHDVTKQDFNNHLYFLKTWKAWNTHIRIFSFVFEEVCSPLGVVGVSHF